MKSPVLQVVTPGHVGMSSQFINSNLVGHCLLKRELIEKVVETAWEECIEALSLFSFAGSLFTRPKASLSPSQSA